MASGSKTVTKETFLVCSCCGNPVQIRRKRNKMKEYEHTKHMYCFKCMEVTAHIEKGEEIFYPTWIKEIMAKEKEDENKKEEMLNESRRCRILESSKENIAVWYC